MKRSKEEMVETTPPLETAEEEKNKNQQIEIEKESQPHQKRQDQRKEEDQKAQRESDRSAANHHSFLGQQFDVKIADLGNACWIVSFGKHFLFSSHSFWPNFSIITSQSPSKRANIVHWKSSLEQ
jgi:hypothetical protein